MSPSTIALVVALVLAFFAVAIGFSARLSIRPGRVRPWSEPRETLGLDYEDVAFPSQDGVPLVGWYIPPPARTGTPAPVIVSLHGWPWCRMGTRANSPLKDLPGGRAVDLMPLYRRFHDEGYGVLAFDVSGYGESGSRGVVTYGWLESRDLLGALAYLEGRGDVDQSRIGVIGFSAGAVTLMFGLPHTDRIRAGVAVQPSTAKHFTDGYARDRFKGLGALPNWITQILYRLAGGPSNAFLQPALQAPGARNVPVLYVQGTGDRWGSREDVAHMAAMTPNGSTYFPETDHRFAGYTHVVENPEVVLAFFGRHLAPEAAAGSGRSEDATPAPI